MNENQKNKAPRIGEIIAGEVQNQIDDQAAANAAIADQTPAFDKRSGTSNFGRRVSQRIQRENQ